MKKFTLFTLIACSTSLASLTAQTAASVTWTLATDSSATVTGNVIAAPQAVSSFLAPKRYGRSFDNATNTGWQGKGEGQTYVAPFDNTIYDEYKIKPVPGNTLKVTQFELSVLGGGTGALRLAVYYSKNAFATFDSLATGSASGGSGATYNSANYRATAVDPIVLLNTNTTPLAGKEIATFPGLNITLNQGDSLMIRTYPFGTTGLRYYPSKLVTITGTTSTAGAVPVTFASAKAFQQSNGIQVEWTTASENNVDKYAIEKSVDGRSFAQTASVTAKGNSTALNAYSWFDATPAIGNNYYRIKSIDKDGVAKYAAVLKVLVGKGSAGIVISPNPIKGSLINLQLKNLNKGIYTLRLVNSAGQQVYTSQLTHDGGSASQVLDIPGLNKGVYNLQISNGSTKLNNTVLVD